MYEITERTKVNARRLNLSVKPSGERDKKIDVYKNNKKIGSVGALGYKDYPTYIKQKGLVYANKRRDLYKIRHKNDIGSGNGKLAFQLLWS
jgi:hypothetical protein